MKSLALRLAVAALAFLLTGCSAWLVPGEPAIVNNSNNSIFNP